MNVPAPRVVTATTRAMAKTWGAAGARRRLIYEAQRRLGLTRRQEDKWLAALVDVDIEFRDLPLVTMPKRDEAPDATIRLYGALEVDPSFPDSWHIHPFTGFRRDVVHWSELSEGDAEQGDIKDLWELGRLTWLGPLLQRVAAGDNDAAEQVWTTIESFDEHNPAFRGPQWMCGQESGLRGIIVTFASYALSDHPSTSAERRDRATRLVAQTVGRVAPTIGYALSQRNNHAISEAAFLWTASHLLHGLPDSGRIEKVGRKALEEAVADQFYEDGAYAQHSPTYQRLALHALLWVVATADAVDAEPPAGVVRAIGDSWYFLSKLMDPGSGQMPNLGGNDGALLFALSPTPIGDFRPVLGHAGRRTGSETVGSGASLSEANWFHMLGKGSASTSASMTAKAISHHVHTTSRSKAVLRAGPLRHRPAHADQLHVDIWIDGTNVAIDPGSYRYTAPPPWQNALAGEEVHNLPRVPGAPQAERRGRFLWTRWTEAEVEDRSSGGERRTLARLRPTPITQLERLLVTDDQMHIVVDRSSDHGALVHWTFPAGVRIEACDQLTRVVGLGWHAALLHNSTAGLRTLDPGDSASGWHSPTYGLREELTAFDVRVTAEGAAVAVFAPADVALPSHARLQETINWIEP